MGIQNRVLFINNQPLIPTGVYFWPDISAPTGRDPFVDIARYGLNTLVAYYEYVKPDRQVTDQPSVKDLRAGCERLGLYYFIGAPNGRLLKDKSDQELQALFAATSREVVDSPFFLGWMFDEPILNGIDQPLMERAIQAIHRYSPDQLVWINFAPLDLRWSDPDWPDMGAYARLGDIVGFDFYPVEMGLPWSGHISKSRIEDFGWYVDKALAWVGEETPVWMIQQGWRRGDLQVPPAETGRRPDSVETRFMSYQALVHGATGIFYFPGSRLGGAIPFDDPTWDIYIRETAASIQSLTSVLSNGEPAGNVVSSVPGVHLLAREEKGKVTLLTVREGLGAKLGAEIKLPEPFSGVMEVVGEDRTVPVIQGAFTDSFPSYGVHVYRQP